MKKFLTGAVLALTALLTGCSDGYKIPDSQYAVKVDANSGADFQNIYTGQTLLLSNMCWNECESILSIDRNVETMVFEGKFYIDASELEMDLGIIVSYKLREGAKAFKQATNTYKSEPSGAQRHISIVEIGKKSIYPYGRDAIRTTINGNKMTVEDVLANQEAVRAGVLKTLRGVVANTPVEITDVRIDTVGQPKLIKERKEALKAMASNQEIALKQIAIDLDTAAKNQEVRVINANNDIEIDKLIQAEMGLTSAEWKTLEAMQTCASNTGCTLILGTDVLPLKK